MRSEASGELRGRALRAALESLFSSVPIAAAPRPDHWDSLVHAALEHGLGTALRDRLRALDLTLPDRAERTLDLGCRTMRLETQRIVDQLEDALAILARASIPTVALKGPLLGARLYGDALARPSSDVDLLIPPDSLDRALSLFRNAGYAISDEDDRYYRRYHHHLHLVHQDRAPLELHFRAFVGFGAVVEAGELLARSVEHACPIAKSARVLALEDEFVYLAVHAANHGFGRLGWLYDLKLMLTRHPELDWSTVEARAEALGLVRPLREALGELVFRLGVEMPASIALPSRFSRAVRDIEARLDLPGRLPESSIIVRAHRSMSEARLSRDAAAGFACVQHNFSRVIFRSWARLSTYARGMR